MKLRRRAWGLTLLVAGAAIDLVLGVDTATPQTLASLDASVPGCCDYEPAPWSAFALALGSTIPVGSVFLDIGSGKGRGVLAAARLPFARVIGVELIPEFHALAEQNLRRFRGRRRCDEVVLLCADAAEQPFPDDVTHVFLNNPVIGEVRERVFAQLGASRARRPRPIRVHYLHAEDERFAEVFPDAQLVRRRRGLAVYDLP